MTKLYPPQESRGEANVQLKKKAYFFPKQIIIVFIVASSYSSQKIQSKKGESNLAEKFRRIIHCMAEKFPQITNYLEEQFGLNTHFFA